MSEQRQNPTFEEPKAPAARRPYEAPKLEKKRSVARVTLGSTGGGQTTTTIVAPGP